MSAGFSNPFPGNLHINDCVALGKQSVSDLEIMSLGTLARSRQHLFFIGSGLFLIVQLGLREKRPVMESAGIMQQQIHFGLEDRRVLRGRSPSPHSPKPLSLMHSEAGHLFIKHPLQEAESLRQG